MLGAPASQAPRLAASMMPGPPPGGDEIVTQPTIGGERAAVFRDKPPKPRASSYHPDWRVRRLARSNAGVPSTAYSKLSASSGEGICALPKTMIVECTPQSLTTRPLHIPMQSALRASRRAAETRRPRPAVDSSSIVSERRCRSSSSFGSRDYCPSPRAASPAPRRGSPLDHRPEPLRQAVAAWPTELECAPRLPGDRETAMAPVAGPHSETDRAAASAPGDAASPEQ